jgi:hypothetical protein
MASDPQSDGRSYLLRFPRLNPRGRGLMWKKASAYRKVRPRVPCRWPKYRSRRWTWVAGQASLRSKSLVLALLGTLRAALKARTDLVLENLALRQQLALLRRRSKRPRVGLLDRVFWMWLSQWWARWREALHVVQPQTVIRWHRRGFRAFWNWKSRRGRTGRPPVDSEIAQLVRTRPSPTPSGARRASRASFSSLV